MRPSSRSLPLLTALWLGGVVAGLGWLAAYSNRPGPPGSAPAEWPGESALARAPDGETLLLFLHPRCSCSLATVAAVAEVAARSPRPPRIHVLFVRPAGFVAGWERTDLWRAAQPIAGATLRCDEDGAEARRFGVETSGKTLLYAADGRLLFEGGVTSSRGHPGESVGRAALVALLSRERPGATCTPVFGCELFEADDGAPRP